MSEVNILDALMVHLTTPALTSPPTPIAFPLVDYTPTLGTAYLRAHPILRAEPDQPGMAFDSDVIHRGIFQVDAVAPEGRGEGPGLSLAVAVAMRFAVGTALDTPSGRLKVLRPPSIARAIKESPWVRLPVSISYFLSANGG